jgi:ethanolamine utilization cobalamin adenosyltransferase
MRLDQNSMRLAFVAELRSMRAEIDAVRATIASEWDALRRELAEARAELYRLKTLVAADRAEKHEIARQRMLVEASCAVRDPEMPLQ